MTAFLIALSGIDTGYSQRSERHVIQGIVVDKESGNPIPTANVYISKTTIGTTTASDGSFVLATDLTGIHILVVSFVGYDTFTRGINLFANGETDIEVELTSNSVELDQLEITASNQEWQDNFRIFRRNFIGTSANSRNTEIENPWVISFEIDEDDNLIAKANRPLVIQNQELGYRLMVDLMEFKWSRKPPIRGEMGYYLFYVNYSELEPANEREMQRWHQNRRDTYIGSFEHFLRSLYNDELRENDFLTLTPDTNSRTNIMQLETISRSSIHLFTNTEGLTSQDIQALKAYHLRSPIEVHHGKGWFQNRRKRSRIIPTNSSGIFLVTANARLVNPLSLRVDGDWSGDRLANLLPYNYLPED